jgi:hypothetical protein
MLTEGTTNAYFVLDRMEPYPITDLQAAGDDLIAQLRAISPEVVIETHLLGAQG